jgi:hypothetical protein
MWKEGVIEYYMALSKHTSEGTEEDYEKFKLGWSVSRPRFEAGQK